jgi:hypothetical protein
VGKIKLKNRQNHSPLLVILGVGAVELVTDAAETDVDDERSSSAASLTATRSRRRNWRGGFVFRFPESAQTTVAVDRDAH